MIVAKTNWFCYKSKCGFGYTIATGIAKDKLNENQMKPNWTEKATWKNACTNNNIRIHWIIFE